ncbi:MAG TPA: sugar transferase, partial [Synergistales bacterium]|nr:sugar transferase [Synergistales bacterium]
MDIFGALFGLIFLSPLFLAVAMLVRHKLGSPVIFTQERAGKDGKPFTIYKFRT